MRQPGKRGVQAIGDILSELVARRGLARLREREHLETAWRAAVGKPGDDYTRVGGLKRGMLEVFVANSVLLQELANFRKQQLVQELQRSLETDEIRDIRFRLDEAT